jgi:hypothetical protein
VEKRVEARGEVPLLPPSPLRLRSVSRGLVMVLIFNMGFGAFMFVFALTVQYGLHADALLGGLSILPMAMAFLAGSLVAARLITRFGRGAMSAGALVQLAGLAWLVTVLASGWPQVSLWDMAGPLALVGAGQSMLFAGLFRAMLADVPAHLGSIGGALITLQQSGLALGVATLGPPLPGAAAAQLSARLRRRRMHPDGDRRAPRDRRGSPAALHQASADAPLVDQ